MFDPDRPDFRVTPVAPERPVTGYFPAGAISEPVVSIVTPYFDTGDIFFETVTSVLRQTFQAWEWIVVDDGSQDQRAREVLEIAAGRDPRIRLLRQSNSGPAAARNAGVARARGKYVCLLDSDDLLEPTFLEQCAWFLETEPAFAFVNARTVSFGTREYAWPHGFERGPAMLDDNSAPAIALVRREAILEVDGFDDSIRVGHEDWDFWLRMAQGGHWGHTLPGYLAWYRQRDTSRLHRFKRDARTNDRFAALMRSRYQHLANAFPAPRKREPTPYESLRFDLPFENPIARPSPSRHILLLVPWMVTGGADKNNLDWTRGLIDAGSRVTVCATVDSHHSWKPRFEAVTPDVFALREFLPTAEIPRFLYYLIRSRGVDTIVLNASTLAYQLLPYLRTCSPEIAIVDVCHVEEPHWLNGGHPRFAVGYQDALDLNIVSTGALREWMVRNGADRPRIAVCYTGIDVEEADPSRFDHDSIRRELAIEPDRPTIAFVGRLCDQKRPLFLCEILARLRDSGRDFQALVLGDGELRESVAKRLFELELIPRVRLLGSVPNRISMQALAVSDIFLLPSVYEGISSALYEAMAMQAVPVVTGASGHSEVVRPDCGFVVPREQGELERYVESLQALLDDPPLRERFARTARAVICEEFNEAICFRSFVEALETARTNARLAPRPAVAPGLARELATLAVEYSRMSSLADFLWAYRQNALANTPTEALDPANDAARRLLDLLLSTRTGGMVLRSRLARRTGAWLSSALERRRRVVAASRA